MTKSKTRRRPVVGFYTDRKKRVRPITLPVSKLRLLKRPFTQHRNLRLKPVKVVSWTESDAVLEEAEKILDRHKVPYDVALWVEGNRIVYVTPEDELSCFAVKNKAERERLKKVLRKERSRVIQNLADTEFIDKCYRQAKLAVVNPKFLAKYLRSGASDEWLKLQIQKIINKVRKEIKKKYGVYPSKEAVEKISKKIW